MEAPIQAMKNLKVKFDHKFSCDIDAHARATIEANFPHAIMYEDLTKRDNKQAPKVDVYVAGFPCQPFSTAGLQQGFKDKKGRGEVFFNVLDYLANAKPRVFILENVVGLVCSNGGEYLASILKELASLKVYNIRHQILNTAENGVPHNRRRWYCVGIHKEFDDGSFAFPGKIPRPSLEKFLEPRSAKLAKSGLPPKSAGTAHKNVKLTLRSLKREGSDPFKDPVVIDCDSSTYRFKSMVDMSPCITVARGKGHWVTNRGRRLMKEEIMRLQGMNPTTFKVVVSAGQLGRQLGNTMSVNVVERLLCKVLPAAKLVRKNEVEDRWANGKALKELAATRGRSFKGMGAKARKFLNVGPGRGRVSNEQAKREGRCVVQTPYRKMREVSPERKLKRSNSDAMSPVRVTNSKKRRAVSVASSPSKRVR